MHIYILSPCSLFITAENNSFPSVISTNLTTWPGLLEAWLALTSVKYHGNLLVLIPLNQRLALTELRATGPRLPSDDEASPALSSNNNQELESVFTKLQHNFWVTFSVEGKKAFFHLRTMMINFCPQFGIALKHKQKKPFPNLNAKPTKTKPTKFPSQCSFAFLYSI